MSEQIPEGLGVLTGPCEVDLLFVFKRKKTHYRSGRFSHLLNKTAPAYPPKPDLDNLVKLYLDSFNGVVWQDDRQVVKLTAEKRYLQPGEEEHTVVRVRVVAYAVA